MKKLFLSLLSLSFVFVACEDEEYLSQVPRYSNITIEHANKSKPEGKYHVGDTLLARAIESQAGKWIDRVEISWTFNRGRNNSGNSSEFVYATGDSPRNPMDTLFLETAGTAEVTMLGYYRSMAELTMYNNEVHADETNKFKATYSTQTTKFMYYDVTLEKRFTVLP